MASSRSAWLLVAFACATFVWWVPAAAHADFIASAPAAQDLAGPAPSAAVSGSASPREVVASRMALVGMPEAEIAPRLAALTVADVQTLAAAPDQIQYAGGDSVEWWVILLTAVTFITLFLLFVFLRKDAQEDDDHVDNSTILLF